MRVTLIPDSPTGCDIIETDFYDVCNSTNSRYAMRAKYKFDFERNVIFITNIPFMTVSNDLRGKIAEAKESGKFPELMSMEDHSGKEVDIRLRLRNDANPHKFMKKLIKNVPGMEKSYPVNVNISVDYQTYDMTIKSVLLAWIRFRRDQKRVMINHRRTSIFAEQRTNDVKIFLMKGDNLDKTISIFKNSKNKADIEANLIKEYKDSEIYMDTLQARTLSELRMYKLSKEEYAACLKRKEELDTELANIEAILNTPNGVDKVIIGELKEGVKKYGSPRKSNVVPLKISFDTEVDGFCILQLSGTGKIMRSIATNVDEEPIPKDSDGFAVKVDNDSSFILIDECGDYAFVKVKELPVDEEFPINRCLSKELKKIVAMLPFSYESTLCCTLITKLGNMKRIRIADMVPKNRPCIRMEENDALVSGLVTKERSNKDILVYTKDGLGARIDPNSIKIRSQFAAGRLGFKLNFEDEIAGCFTIDSEQNKYLLYVTKRGRMRLNEAKYLPLRGSSDKESMVRLITLTDRDDLVSILGCNKSDTVQVFYLDGKTENVKISSLREETMSSEPKKVVMQNTISNVIVKTKLI